MKTKLLLTFVLIGMVHTIFANTYPITPRPLRKLVKESKYIVFASVIKIEKNVTGEDWHSAKATLVIKETLQGKIKHDTISVFFAPNMVCPAPANYTKNSTVLAFLYKKQDGKGYFTHALSYGSKTINQEAYLVYKKRIQEMQSILKIKNKVERDLKTVDWLVACASNKYTRWEGTYELSPTSDFMSSYDRDKETFTRKRFLDRKHIQSLTKAFLEIDKVTYQDMGLIDIIASVDDEIVLSFLTDQLKKANLEEIWFSEFLLERVVYLSGREDLKSILQEINSIDFFDKEKSKKASVLIKKFIDEL